MRRQVFPLFLLLLFVCLFVSLSPTANTAERRSATSATQSEFLTPLEKEIIAEMNLARTQPQKYAAFVEEYKKHYTGNRLLLPGRQKAIATFEGIAAVDEAIKFLQTASPLPPLETAKALCEAAKDHAADLSVKGITGHKGSDGTYPNARVDRYGKWTDAIAENIVYDIGTAREMVIALIIDDGTPNRGHRGNIFNPAHRFTGVSVSPAAAFGSKCVIDYVGGFKE